MIHWELLLLIVPISLVVGLAIGMAFTKKQAERQLKQDVSEAIYLLCAEPHRGKRIRKEITDGSEESQRHFGISPTMADEIIKKGQSFKKD